MIIAVHGGAGNHSRQNEKEVREALKSACDSALRKLRTGSDSLAAIEDSLCILEDSVCLNAGCGSNLTITGTVECDAAVMCGSDEAFGSVAAVSGIKNPIKAARVVLDGGRIPSKFGLVPPLCLASSGAHEYAINKGIETISPTDMLTKQSIADWKMWKSRLEHQEPVQPNLMDTVGCVSLDSSGILAAGVSSGGLLLKEPGRIGQAAIFGAGCWAKSIAGASDGVSCSVSGEGEQIIRAALARSICEAIARSPDEADEAIIRTIASSIKSDDPQVGVLVLAKEPNDDGNFTPRLWCAFTTASMAIGYVSSSMSKPKTAIVRRPEVHKQSSSVYIVSLNTF